MKKNELTADQIDEIVWALDSLSKLTKALYTPIAVMGDLGMTNGEVTVKVTSDGRPMTPKEAQQLVEYVESEEMQDDLRAIAAALRLQEESATPAE